jgi:A/G-specific adenine glycosylase
VEASLKKQSGRVRRAIQRSSAQLARELPWIGHSDPWAIFVSEVMLQQTQTHRVIEPWERFLSAFPTPRDLADSPLSMVLRHWSGLGFTRRAKFLQQASMVMCEQFGGTVPSTVAELRSLPGIGEYSANAIASFAFNEPVAILDTNVGRVLSRAVANECLTPTRARAMASELLPGTEVAQFNQALLDLGAQYCRKAPLCGECPIRTSCAWHENGGEDPAVNSFGVSKPQSPFHGSKRQLRGRVLRILAQGKTSGSKLQRECAIDDAVIFQDVMQGLRADGLVERHARSWQLCGD